MKVLIADDEAVSRRLLEASLRRWGYEVIVANDGVEAARILRSPDAPKLVILDWLMPGIDGVQLCREIRQQKQEPYTYILLLTGKRAKCDVIEGLEAGADDYVVKPFDTEELKVRLRTGKRILYLQEQLISTRDALRDLATRDSLTGLWNRAAILDFLANELARASRQKSSVGLLLLDVDHFKQVNDTFGHLIGDEVLRRVSQSLRTATRLYDAVGRYGGEEFLIVLPGCDETNAVSHAERLRAAVSRVSINTPTGTVSVAVSLGVTVFDSQRDDDSNELIARADAGLYLAKQNGRNRVEIGRTSDLTFLREPDSVTIV
jgi:two-component system, cell cycle response regulator